MIRDSSDSSEPSKGDGVRNASAHRRRLCLGMMTVFVFLCFGCVLVLIAAQRSHESLMLNKY
jgi:hypothetical protein